MTVIDQNGLEAAVRECARITAPEVTDEEFERERAEGSSRYLKTREEISRAIGAYLSAQQREPVVRVKELEWKLRSSAFGDEWKAETVVGRYDVGLVHVAFSAIRRSVDGPDAHDTVLIRGVGFEEAKSAAQADYEQRIMAAIEIAPQSDRQPSLDRKQVSETGKELPENAEQPMNNADVSVGELAGFFVTEFPHLLTMSTQIEVARALLARFRIERLDRLASGRR